MSFQLVKMLTRESAIMRDHWCNEFWSINGHKVIALAWIGGERSREPDVSSITSWKTKAMLHVVLFNSMHGLVSPLLIVQEIILLFLPNDLLLVDVCGNWLIHSFGFRGSCCTRSSQLPSFQGMSFWG
jgi:hypothetical protein